MSTISFIVSIFKNHLIKECDFKINQSIGNKIYKCIVTELPCPVYIIDCYLMCDN